MRIRWDYAHNVDASLSSTSKLSKLFNFIDQNVSHSTQINRWKKSNGGLKEKKRVKFFFEFNLQGHLVTLCRRQPAALSWGYRLIDLLMHFIRVTLGYDYSHPLDDKLGTQLKYGIFIRWMVLCYVKCGQHVWLETQDTQFESQSRHFPLFSF